MCLFITAVVPRAALSGQLQEVAHKHRLSFTPHDDAHVQAQLRPTEVYLIATATYCDCGSPLFFAPKERTPELEARQVSKLRKKKWSEARIKKWLEATGPRPDDPNAPPSGVRSRGQWAAFLEEALQLADVPYIALIGHWDDGNAPFTLLRREAHAVDQLLGERHALDWDVVHEFRAAGTLGQR